LGEIAGRTVSGELSDEFLPPEAYLADRKPFSLKSGIWLPDDYGTPT